MSEVKWIRLNTDMFDNRKIKYLRTLPEGNNIVLIWVMLLTMAGRCNASGMIFLTENIPYTEKALSDELGFDLNLVHVALNVLEKLDMVCMNEETLSIPGWEEHQNTLGLEKIRDDTRKRVQKYRERRTIPECNALHTVTVTQQNKNKKENIYTTPYTPLPGVVSVDENLKKVVEAYEGDIGTLSRTTADRLKSWLEEFDADLILSAISEAAIQNKRTLAYVSAILKRCRETGIKTAAEFETEKASHEEKKTEEPKWKKIY